MGRVVMTLFRSEDPPPPWGSASGPVSLLTVAADALFGGAADCMPAQPTAEQRAAFVTRSAPFVWPNVPLGERDPVSYQIRAFYDYDEDFVPFYSVRNGVTRGDVIGAAFDDARTGAPSLRSIVFGARTERRQGEVVAGVTVALSAPVNTERPVFELADVSVALPSDGRMGLDLDPAAVDAALWKQAPVQLRLAAAGDVRYRAALQEAGYAASNTFDFSAASYAWYVRDVPAAASDGDGMAGPLVHPVLGAWGLTWRTPAVIMERARTPRERALGVPRVVLFGSPRLESTAETPVLAPDVDIVVAPVAMVDLEPALPQCRVAYVPAGNAAQLYEGRPTDCQRLPSGRYDISVYHGVAGAVAQPAGPGDPASETGFVLVGGTLAGQGWRIPNELGPADTLYDPLAVDQLPRPLLVEAQGPAGRFTVFDPDPSADLRLGCGQAPDPLNGGAQRSVSPTRVPAACCAAVVHLCHRSVCRVRDDGWGRPIRAAALGDDCIPFHMPASCCASGRGGAGDGR